MRWRIELQHSTGRKKQRVAILELDADELEEIASMSEKQEGQTAFDLRTAHSALLREEVEARRT